MWGNEETGLRPNTIYAELVNNDGSLLISATLEHILVSIRDRDLVVEGVKVDKSNPRCSVVTMESK
jgi:hypothetical protein